MSQYNLSILTFCCNDVNSIIKLIDNVNDIAEEIIIIDSSKLNNHKMLLDYISKNKLQKIKVYAGAPTAYYEPLRMYGINKCKNDWVLQLDADELLSNNLKSIIKYLLQQENVVGFFIPRKNNKIIWHALRLYKKKHVYAHGTINEDIKFNGKILTLKNKFSIIHNTDFFGNVNKINRYLVIEGYTNRLNYLQLHKNIQNKYLQKIFLIYCRIKNSNNNCELSFIDYILFYSFANLIALYNSFKEKRFISYIGSFWFNIYYNKLKQKYFFSVDEKERKDQLKISIDIQKHDGPTRYLSLNEDKVVKILSKYIDNDPDTLKSFINILKTRYKYGKFYYKFL